MKTLQDVTKDFFESILAVISKNSSKNYGIVILNNMKKSLVKDFPILELIDFDNGSMVIDAKIKSADDQDLSNLFNKIIEIISPDVLRLFIKDQLDAGD